MRQLAILLLAAPVLSVAATTVPAPSRITAVTVYRNSARVSRTARLALPAGASRVVMEGLPDGLDDDSIRVEGKGSAKARFFGVTVERVTGETAGATEARSAEERLERLQDEDRSLEDRIRAAQARGKFAESLRSTYSEERSKNLAVRGVSAKELVEVASFVASEIATMAGEVRKAEGARRELARKITQARADLEKLQAKRGRTAKAVSVELEAEKGGAFDLTLSYVVPSAGWQPIWDARLAPDKSTMELSFLGSVWQRSGEDWSDVALSVSTAQPARGLLVPELEPVYLRRAEPPRPMFDAMKRRFAPSAPAPAARAEAKPMAEAEEEDLESEPIEVVQASVQEGLLSAKFTAPRRESVDGSGRARKVALARFPLKAEIMRTCAPRVASSAFLTAKATNETGVPLLAGSAGVYVGDEFAGRAPVPATPPGGEITLSFGADDRVEVERKVLERRRESAGLLSKDEVIRYRIRIGVKNRYAAPVALKLLDLVPVSRDEKIRVTVLEGTTAPTREDPKRPGVRTYEMKLGPREEREIELRYEVRYPRNFPVAGLD